MKVFIKASAINKAIDKITQIPQNTKNEDDYNSLIWLRRRCNKDHNEWGEIELEDFWLIGIQEFVISWLNPSTCSEESNEDLAC